MSSWGPLALTTVTAVLLALPVTPALYELWKRADATPLPTTRHDGRITNFAETFRSRVEPLRSQLEICSNRREVAKTRIDGMEVLLVGSDEFDFDPQLTRGVSTVMLGRTGFIPDGRVVEADIYAEGALHVGEHAAIRAALSQKDIILGRNSAALRWLHADGTVEMRGGSAAYGRLSAGQSIYLEPGCAFQRMYAPHIITVDATAAVPPPGSEPSGEIAQEAPHDLFASSPHRLRVPGRFLLPPGETMHGNLIATGEVRFGARSQFFGNVKGYKDVFFDEETGVHGSVVGGNTVHLGARTSVAGPVMAEADVLIASGGRVGTPNSLTTISACGIQVATGCHLHGTIWARVRGTIEA